MKKTNDEHVTAFVCETPGLVHGDGITIAKLPDGTWTATQPVGSLFGCAVQGETTGTGSNEEEAREDLKCKQSAMYDAMWYEPTEEDLKGLWTEEEEDL